MGLDKSATIVFMTFSYRAFYSLQDCSAISIGFIKIKFEMPMILKHG